MSGVDDTYKFLTSVIKYSCFWLYDGTAKYFEGFNYSNPIEARHFNNYNRFQQADDWRKLEKKGLTKEMLDGFLQSVRSLRKFLLLPVFIGEQSSFNQISLAYYSAVINDLRDLVNDVNSKLEECPEKLLNRDIWSSNFVSYFDNQEKKIGISANVELANPYYIYNNNKEQMVNNLVSFIEENSKDMDLSKLVYKGEFTKIKDIVTQLKEKNLKKEEMKDFLQAYGSMICKGFAMCQINYKMTPADLASSKSSLQFQNISTDQAELVSQLKCLMRYSSMLFRTVGTIDYDVFTNIYQRHQGDDVGSILKPFIEDFLPYFKSIEPPKGTAKWFIILSDMFSFIQDYYSKHYLFANIGLFKKQQKPNAFIFAPVFFPSLFDLLPIVVDEAPSEKYAEMVKACVLRTKNNHFSMFFNQLHTEKKMPIDIEEIEDFDTLNKQKLYIAWYLVNTHTDHGRSLNGSIIYALLAVTIPWRIDDDSEEAREIESRVKYYLMQIVEYIESKGDDAYFQSLAANFIFKYLLKATEPLDVEFFRNAIANNFQVGYGDGCCAVQ